MSKLEITVAHLTTVHARFDTRIFKKMCTSLSTAGYKVFLIVADGKGNVIENEVTVLDVGVSNGRIDRIFNTSKRAFKKACELKADIYHVHDPELLPVALRLKALGNKVVYDIHEMTRVQILSKKWLPFFLRKTLGFIFAKYEDYACRRLDYLITPQAEMTLYYSTLNRCETVYNFPEYKQEINRLSASKFNIIYAGSISKERGLYNCFGLIDALVRLDSRYRLILACPVSKELLDLVESSKSKKNIDFVGYLKTNQLFELYAGSAIGLILFNNVGQYYMANALKLFEYMSCGLYVIMPNFGSWVDFNAKYSVGMNVNTSSYDEIAKKIINLSDDELSRVSNNNIRLVESEFSWNSEAKKLIKLYQEIVI